MLRFCRLYFSNYFHFHLREIVTKQRKKQHDKRMAAIYWEVETGPPCIGQRCNLSEAKIRVCAYRGHRLSCNPYIRTLYITTHTAPLLRQNGIFDTSQRTWLPKAFEFRHLLQTLCNYSNNLLEFTFIILQKWVGNGKIKILILLKRNLALTSALLFRSRRKPLTCRRPRIFNWTGHSMDSVRSTVRSIVQANNKTKKG
jgi:hypothetical protein